MADGPARQDIEAVRQRQFVSFGGNRFGCGRGTFGRIVRPGMDETMKRIAPRVSVDEGVRFGRPVIEGTRVPVDLILGKLGGGVSAEELCDEYDLTRDDILAALAYAASVLAEEQVRAVG